jgi:hypothetical protein
MKKSTREQSKFNEILRECNMKNNKEKDIS